jgi:hypothetical protein
MENVTQPQRPSILQSIGNLARSFFKALGEAATKLDELPLEEKQQIKEGFVRLLSTNAETRASAKLLTSEDDELSRILSAHGWWILSRDINGPVKRALLQLGREGKAAEIDRYLCSLFSENDAARLRQKIESWFKIPYLTDRREIIFDSLDAHTRGKWTLTVPTLLPLVDGLMRRFRKEHLRRSKNPHKTMHADRFVDYYRRKRPKLFGKSLKHFMLKQMFAKFDLNNGASPSSINRHAILHGEIFDYATQANSLRVFLLLDTISQFIQTVENRKSSKVAKNGARRKGD